MSGPFPSGFDGPRELPDGLRQRLLAEITDRPLIATLEGAAGARALPGGLGARLEATVLGSAAGARAIPLRLRRRLERTLVGPRAPARLVVAAVVLLVLGMLALPFVGRDGVGDGTPSALPTPRTSAPEPEPGGLGEPAGGGDAGAAGDPSTATPPDAGDSLSPSGDAGRPGAPAGSGQAVPGSDAGAGESGPPPPFAYGPEFGVSLGTAFSHAGEAPPEPEPAPPPPPPLRIGVVGSDTPAAAGFEAYVDRLNHHGGVRGRTVETVPTSASSPANDVVAVVNVGDQPIAGESGAPDWVSGPLVETLTVREDALAGRVFSFGSVLERQAHIAVAASLGDDVPPGTRAVVYRAAATGPYGGRATDAFVEAIDAAGAIATVVTVDPDDPVLLPADAAFVSMPTAQARAFLDATNEAGYRPDHGVWGLASLYDEAIIESFGDETRVASPYAPAAADELQALRDGSGEAVSAGSIHGWMAAKALAVAAYESDVGTPDAMVDALVALEGWQTSFVPPYEVRPGTRSRTPEAVVLGVADGAFRVEGEFRRDVL